MKERNVPIAPFVCSLNSGVRFNRAMEEMAPLLEFLPDGMVLEAEWRANPVLAQELEEERAQQTNRVPGGIFLRQARFALALKRLLRGRDVSHVHATSSRALVCALILKRLLNVTVSATIEPRPEPPRNWIQDALSECVGGRLSDRKLLEQYHCRAPVSDASSEMKKAILLAGGAGTRLFPLTKIVCKQLLPIYDKPMICYPLATLMLGGLREVLIISTPKDLPMLQDYLADGAQLGIRIEYGAQPKPEGIAQAFLIGAKFIGESGASLILGDNIFYGKLDFYRDALAIERGACIFGYQVRDPERYGVVEFDAEGKAISLEEKPRQPKSPFAVPGLYVYDDQVVDLCRTLRPSARGELEITDLNLIYLQRSELHVKLLSRGMAWLDTGTTTALLEASNYIATIEHRQGLKIACLEEVALRMGFITQSDLAKIIDGLPRNEYREYLRMVCDEGPSAGPEPVG